MILLKKFIHVVGAVMVNGKDEILCALRSPDMSIANHWEFPGGKIEQGETKEQALMREIQEELGCKIDVFEPVEDTTYEYDTFIVRLETFMAKVVSGKPTASEHAELRWVKRSDLGELTWAPADIPAVEKLVN